MDPLFNLVFVSHDGRLASYKEVSANWQYFQQQVPRTEDPELKYPVGYYDYRGVRYTNWSKIPVLMPALHSLLRLVFGDSIEEVSLRAYVLNVNALLVMVSALALVTVAGAGAWSRYGGCLKKLRSREGSAFAESDPAE
jgi:hypothetical protein